MRWLDLVLMTDPTWYRDAIRSGCCLRQLESLLQFLSAFSLEYCFYSPHFEHKRTLPYLSYPFKHPSFYVSAHTHHPTLPQR